VRLEKDVVRRYAESMNLDLRSFTAEPDGIKAYEIVKNGGPDMQKDVKILSDPVALLDYKTRVQPVLLQGCATISCHGGTGGGRFILYNPAENDTVTYTNFYILSQFVSKYPPPPTKDDQIDRRLIDRTYPINSLILQFGYARDRAEFDHWDVPGWKPVFQNNQDQRLSTIHAWIKDVLVPVQPEYGFEFPLPGMKPTTQPAAPAGQQAPAPAQPAPPAR
jgi:hypothetical protein